MGNALQPVQQGSSTQQHASRHSSEQDTMLWAVLALHHLSFRFPSAGKKWCVPLDAFGKSRASQSLELLKSLSACWHMLFNRGLKWILIIPVTEQAGKHGSVNISQGYFFLGKINSWKSNLHSTPPVAIIKRWHTLEIDGKPRALRFHTLFISAFTAPVLEHLFIYSFYWEVLCLMWIEALTFDAHIVQGNKLFGYDVSKI